ncbi:DUF5606 domain-containing protein [Cytophagaceae bacterium DM2B3-1]|uniref:DUF5606 domain-containing protein n=1 Tax=Xanthocytophaga flava TaxID=3048013 RepID=A0ABT7CQF9_9BACT|nr:DUF5606 domain-containing protein [Xanthocytophaga flavus]MDJ1468046.1 DUF5606 domain-containing protein [Xanthocytophaga flavus]MDJ1495941.1 DUF5606 domain-containing protein [Xanthocytophaga flavus]
MELKEIVTVSGKGGLFKVVKPTRTGMILESMDKQKTRFIVGPQHRLSLLSEISVYTNTSEGSTPLQDVLYNLGDNYGDKGLPVSGKSSPEELASFMGTAVPDYDRDRVYASDIKKLVTWYGILLEYAPEILKKQEATAAVAEEKAEASEEKASAETEETPAPKKTTKKKQKSEA